MSSTQGQTQGAVRTHLSLLGLIAFLMRLPVDPRILANRHFERDIESPPLLAPGWTVVAFLLGLAIYLGYLLLVRKAWLEPCSKSSRRGLTPRGGLS